MILICRTYYDVLCTAVIEELMASEVITKDQLTYHQDPLSIFSKFRTPFICAANSFFEFDYKVFEIIFHE